MTSGRSVHAIVERLLRTLNEKLSVEYALGYPVELTTVDECIVSYLTQLGESLDEMVRVASESGCGLSALLAEPARTNGKDSEGFGKDSERFGKDSESSERLRLQLEQMASRLIELQRVEVEQKAQILKLESEKLGRVEGVVGVVEGVSEVSLDVIKCKHYEREVERLRDQNRLLDSQAVFYYEEMKCMLERLKLQMERNGLLEADSSEVRDQLERTRSSYEVQMSAMSDHLVEMTERMSRQEEEIERLRQDLVSVQAAGVASGKVANAKSNNKRAK